MEISKNATSIFRNTARILMYIDYNNTVTSLNLET